MTYEFGAMSYRHRAAIDSIFNVQRAPLNMKEARPVPMPNSNACYIGVDLTLGNNHEDRFTRPRRVRLGYLRHAPAACQQGNNLWRWTVPADAAATNRRPVCLTPRSAVAQSPPP